MKKAFTLIELLVVIAIIAILAAILFPVFASAKLMAKKAVAISNQKQIGLALIMYATDYDDYYPRSDACTLNDSMNPKFNTLPIGSNPTPYCNGSANPGAYAFRDNHYSWQKWVEPYIHNVPMFIDPVMAPDPTGYNITGELEGGYALNGAITGELNTWPTPSTYGAFRDSWLGSGNTTSVPDPSSAMIIMEQGLDAIVPSMEWPTNKQECNLFPLAVQEHWLAYFYQLGGSGPCGTSYKIDNNSAPYTNTVPLSYCDGHSKAIPVGQFISNTPTSTQYGIAFNAAVCQEAQPGSPIAVFYYETVQPSWTQPWPMWGLQ